MKDRTQRQQTLTLVHHHGAGFILQRMKACSYSGVQSGILAQQQKKSLKILFSCY